MNDRRPKALVTAPFRGEGMDTLQSLADVVYDPWIEQVPLRLYDGEKLAARVQDENADILIVESDFVNGPVFDLPLRMIGSCRGDPNNVDIDAATKAGIPVLRAPGRNANAVAELTLALLFAANRFVVPSDADVRNGKVYSGGKIPYQRYRAWELAGRTVGIIGLGAVGRAAKWRFEGIGMRVLSFDPYNPEATHNDNLDAMLGECDVVSVHAIVTPETEGIVGAAQFAAMKPGAIYINSARAVLHDTDALVASLRIGSSRRRRPRPLQRREPSDRSSARVDEERRADAAYRRRDLRHRSEPLEAHCRRRRAPACAATSRSTV